MHMKAAVEVPCFAGNQRTGAYCHWRTAVVHKFRPLDDSQTEAETRAWLDVQLEHPRVYL